MIKHAIYDNIRKYQMLEMKYIKPLYLKYRKHKDLNKRIVCYKSWIEKPNTTEILIIPKLIHIFNIILIETQTGI